MKKRKIMPPVLVLLIIACLLVYFVLIRKGVRDGEIITSGHIEVTEVDMSFRLQGHVARLWVDEGARVKKGDVLAELDQEPIRKDGIKPWPLSEFKQVFLFPFHEHQQEVLDGSEEGGGCLGC
jgi:multidrug efflux pump subunit AcrA (membrane-fusion protein)